MTDIETVKFINADAAKPEIEFDVERSAIPDIVKWYCAFWSGEPVEVYVNNVRQKLDKDFGLMEGRIYD